MRVRTVILAVAGLAVVAVAGGAWWLYASRDALIKRAIEHFGPELTGVSIKVKAVKLEPIEGRGAITGLEIGNPRGFSTAHALTLGEMRLALDPATLTSDVVRIRELTLEAPNITYERGAQGDNLSAIQKHIESQLPKSKPAAPGKDAASPERKFIVDHVQVRGAKVNYGGAVTLDMPELHLRDLGKRTNGATAAQIADEVWKEVTRMAVNRAPAALEGLRDQAKDAVDRARGLFK